jgi:predicted nucleotidyltransferase
MKTGTRLLILIDRTEDIMAEAILEDTIVVNGNTKYLITFNDGSPREEGEPDEIKIVSPSDVRQIIRKYRND